MNAVSSRSHLILTLKVQKIASNNAVTQAKLNIVDLAGSERIKNSGVSGEKLEQLKHINKSLFVLA